MAKHISIDTSILSSDISSLNSQVKEARNQMNQMVNSMIELDAMWDGEANQEFVKQFQYDVESAEGLFESLEQIIESIEYAKKEYDKCDNDVEGIIASIVVE